MTKLASHWQPKADPSCALKVDQRGVQSPQLEGRAFGNLLGRTLTRRSHAFWSMRPICCALKSVRISRKLRLYIGIGH